MNTAMTNEIIELLPSADLKAKIKEINHQFTEEELLEIILEYAPTFDAKLDLFARFAEIASPELAALARVYIENEKSNFERFLKAEDGFVYELAIKDTPDAYEEEYLCASYHDALVCIDRFYEEYADIGTKETEKSRYKITKRKIFSENSAFEEDAYSNCLLGPNKVLLEVWNRNSTDCDAETSCSECKELCPHRCIDVLFPCFAHNYDIIKYSDYQLKEHFAVCLCTVSCEKRCNGLIDFFYVLPLDAHTIQSGDFENLFDCHDHIALPVATLATRDDLDETQRKNYDAFVAFWKDKKNS